MGFNHIQRSRVFIKLFDLRKLPFRGLKSFMMWERKRNNRKPNTSNLHFINRKTLWCIQKCFSMSTIIVWRIFKNAFSAFNQIYEEKLFKFSPNSELVWFSPSIRITFRLYSIKLVSANERSTKYQFSRSDEKFFCFAESTWNNKLGKQIILVR